MKKILSKKILVVLLFSVLISFGFLSINSNINKSYALVNMGDDNVIDISDDNNDKKIFETMVDIIGSIGKYVGIIVILWGLFQLILAFKREDSGDIAKNVTMIVVGGVLLGFGLTLRTLYEAIMADAK